MRYFTKEWYNDSLVSEMCFNLRKTEKAGEFSEKFFNSLYEVERKAFLRHAKRSARIERKRFDTAIANDEFYNNYNENLEFVKKCLPEEILSEIKDVRILALGSVTYDMAAKITRHCGALHNKCEAVKRRYDEATDALVDKIGGSIPSLYSELWGAPIASVSIENGSAFVTTSAEYTGVAVKVKMSGASLVECDESIEGCMISNYELLLHENGGFEFSLLALRDSLTLKTLTFTADSIEIEKI